MQPHLIVPVGTQVVSRVDVNTEAGVCLAGAVGKIVKAPTDNSHSYEIELPDGRQLHLQRHQFSLRKQYQTQGFPDFLADYNLQDYVIYRCVVGSRAYGLDDEYSDCDRRGIYLPPAPLHWSLYGIPEQIEDKPAQECYWELQKFLLLALKANPNVLECLYSPLIETATPLAQMLLDQRTMFLSRLVYQTYNGYALSQFKKMEQDLRSKGHIRWKHAMHLIRLLLSGITVLKEGFVPVDMRDYRERLLGIKYEHWTWPQVDQWRLQLHRQFEQAFAQTQLPERPNYEQANAFLIEARQSMV
ncbi:DNA polymerase beta superfamily protein [Acaryochloris sp. CCMEE 5410]|uniref:nucleotidyltransferase domain-containing protein n=1 Tax=Acaryochloris sp. CCMEE 5410 TaxID=310037 RepID=UPI0002483C8A|nr:nucleotidyltransferase domain-containing protein [Acaryochloris sp. CCMEE 5410]KAI9130931.1 nucleotidyltransferase domain-containing protein [Acaryochloris sp. CCMEE 5410]